jgi:hypothetical protein
LDEGSEVAAAAYKGVGPRLGVRAKLRWRAPRGFGGARGVQVGDHMSAAASSGEAERATLDQNLRWAVTPVERR